MQSHLPLLCFITLTLIQGCTSTAPSLKPIIKVQSEAKVGVESYIVASLMKSEMPPARFNHNLGELTLNLLNLPHQNEAQLKSSLQTLVQSPQLLKNKTQALFPLSEAHTQAGQISPIGGLFSVQSSPHRTILDALRNSLTYLEQPRSALPVAIARIGAQVSSFHNQLLLAAITLDLNIPQIGDRVTATAIYYELGLSWSTNLSQKAARLSQEDQIAAAIKIIAQEIDKSDLPESELTKLIDRLAKTTKDEVANACQNYRNMRNGTTTLNETMAERRLDQVQSGTALLGFLMDKVLNQKEDAKKIIKTVNTTVAVARTVSRLFSGKMATDIATGNILGLTTDLLGELAGISSVMGPSADELILQGIFDIRQDIAQLQTKMNDRFDRVDQSLAHMDLKLTEIYNRLTLIESNLVDIDHNIRGLFQLIYGLERNSFLEKAQHCIGPFAPGIYPETFAHTNDVLHCASLFQQRATTLVPIESPLSRMIVSPDPLQVEDYQALSSRAESQLELLNIGEFASVVNIVLKRSDNPESQTLSNNIRTVSGSAEWFEGAYGYLKLSALFPNILGTEATRGAPFGAARSLIAGMIQKGLEIARVLDGLTQSEVLLALQNEVQAQLHSLRLVAMNPSATSTQLELAFYKLSAAYLAHDRTFLLSKAVSLQDSVLPPANLNALKAKLSPTVSINERIRAFRMISEQIEARDNVIVASNRSESQQMHVRFAQSTNTILGQLLTDLNVLK